MSGSPPASPRASLWRLALCVVLPALLAVTPAQAATTVPESVVGQWCLIHMEVPRYQGVTFKGWMRIDPPGDDGLAAGELFVEAPAEGAYGRQSLVVEPAENGLVIATGTLVDSVAWAEDQLIMHVDPRGQLVGEGIDVLGTDFSYVFRRGSGDCQPFTI